MSLWKSWSGYPIIYNNIIGINLGNNKGYFIQKITREFNKEEKFKKYNENNVANIADVEITIMYKICY